MSSWSLEKKKSPLSLDASALGDCHLVHTAMLTVGLFLVDRYCLPIQDGLDKLQESHMTEYHTAHRRMEVDL